MKAHLIIDYFSNAPESHRLGLLVISIGFVWSLENLQHWKFNYSRWKHAFTNAKFILTDGCVQVFMGIILLKELNWINLHNWGLVRYIPFTGNPLIHFIIIFLLLDLLEYVYHLLMHRYHFLWRFHAVHHADTHMDVSTTLREHPGETLIRLTFLVVFIFITGASFWALIARQFIQIFANVFAHARFRLPAPVDKVLSLLFVTPNVHHVHHHKNKPFTDSNYGDVLVIWDRILGTFRKLPADKIVFGLDTLPEPNEGPVFQQLLSIPFKGPELDASENQYSVNTQEIQASEFS